MAGIKLNELPSIKQSDTPTGSGEITTFDGGAKVFPNLKDPIALQDASTRNYTDTKVAPLGTSVNNEITVWSGATNKIIKGAGYTVGEIASVLTNIPSFDGELINVDGDAATYDFITTDFWSVANLTDTFRDKSYQVITIRDASENASLKRIRIRRDDAAAIDDAPEISINTNNGFIRLLANNGDIHVLDNEQRINKWAPKNADKNILFLPSSTTSTIARIMWEASTQQLKIFKGTPAVEDMKISFRNDGVQEGVAYIFPGVGALSTDAEFLVTTNAYFSKDGTYDSVYDLNDPQDYIHLQCILDFGDTDFFNLDLTLKKLTNHFAITGTANRVKI